MRLIFFLLFLVLLVKIANAETRLEIENKIRVEASNAGLDPDLAVAIATVESGLNPKAVGLLNEQGLFQLRPEFHLLNGSVNNNVKVGVRYLTQLRNAAKGCYGNAWFVLYNYGPGRPPKRPELTKYYKKVMKEMNVIKTNRYLIAEN